MAAPLEGHDTVVEMHRQRRSGELAGRQRAPRIVGVQRVDQILAGFDEGSLVLVTAAVIRPIGGMQILDHVDPVSRQPGIQRRERRLDMRHDVAAVVKHDIGRAELVDDAVQEFLVRLVSDPDIDLIFGEMLALRTNVDADDAGIGTEKPFPHLQRTALAAADLDEQDVGIHESAEMALIGGEIMLPLMNDAFVVIQKISPQAHQLSSPFKVGSSRGGADGTFGKPSPRSVI